MAQKTEQLPKETLDKLVSYQNQVPLLTKRLIKLRKLAWV